MVGYAFTAWTFVWIATTLMPQRGMPCGERQTMLLLLNAPLLVSALLLQMMGKGTWMQQLAQENIATTAYVTADLV